MTKQSTGKTEVKKQEKQNTAKAPVIKSADAKNAKSVYAEKKGKSKKPFRKSTKKQDEFAQEIVDLARVTRVMAGGKRMRFRACVAIGDRKGKIAVGLAKGADVTIAINKAVNDAKKKIVDVPIHNETIAHEIFEKYGAAKVLLKPAGAGKGVIAGGAMRIVLGLSGISNITCKNIGTSNKVSIAKCTVKALSNLKRTEQKQAVAKNKGNEKKVDKKEVKKDFESKK